MDRRTGNQEASSSLCSFGFLDCFPSKTENVQWRRSGQPIITREPSPVDRQPHLVEPMRLRVYDDIPSTPTTVASPQFTPWRKTMTTRTESSDSIKGIRRKGPTKSMISKPQPMAEVINDPPVRRGRAFRPLQLSIYVDENRLSDLPQFDRLSFTDTGELKRPIKALVRTQSDGMLRNHAKVATAMPKRTASMFETPSLSLTRPDTSHSIVSTSRPPSEYDALHSHPVSWASLPGIPLPKTHKADNIVDVLTPMKEEFSPVETAAVSVNGTVLRFPDPVEPASRTAVSEPELVPDLQAPYPIVSSGPMSAKERTRQGSAPVNSRATFHAQKRVSQWLQYRAQSTSTSTIGSVSTTASFAEHRRKRSEFYKLGQQAQVPAAISTATLTTPPAVAQAPTTAPSRAMIPASAPAPALPTAPAQSFDFAGAFLPHQHERTNTASTVQTVDTTVLSSAFDIDSKRNSQDSMTTLSVVEVDTDIRSRSGTVKSVHSPIGLRIVTPGEQDFAISPAFTGEIVNDDKGPFLREINGHLRSPGVGIAF